MPYGQEHFDVSGKVSSEMMEEFLRDNSLRRPYPCQPESSACDRVEAAFRASARLGQNYRASAAGDRSRRANLRPRQTTWRMFSGQGPRQGPKDSCGMFVPLKLAEGPFAISGVAWSFGFKDNIRRRGKHTNGSLQRPGQRFRLLRPRDLRHAGQEVRFGSPLRSQAPAAKMSLRYSRIFYKAAKKWRGYGFSYLNGRDPVGMLLNIDCKEDWLSKLRDVNISKEPGRNMQGGCAHVCWF